MKRKNYTYGIVLILSLFIFGEGAMYGSSNYYLKGTVNAQSNGNGKAYISKTNSIGTDTSISFLKTENSTSAPTLTIDSTVYLKAVPDTYYHFVEWREESASGTFIGNTEDGQNYTPHFEATGKTDTAKVSKSVYAIFGHDTYIVHFDANGGSGTMDDQVIESGVPTKLNKRKFESNYTVEYSANGGTVNGSSTWSETKTRFTRWKHFNSAGKEASGDQRFDPYNDEDTITKTLSHGTTITLKATWANNNVAFKLPAATRGNRTLNGWYDAQTGGNNKGNAGNTIYTGNLILYAQWGDPFYSKVILSATSGSGATPTADATQKESDYSNQPLVFNISTPANSNGYHFVKWTGTNASFDDSTSSNTTATVRTSTTAGSSNATIADVLAKYEQNLYYASLTATSGGNGTVTVDSSPKSTTTSGGDIVFNLTITPNSGYHLNTITITKGSGSITDNKITVTASNEYGQDKAKQYTVNVTFAQDQYFAKLTTATSTAGTGTSTGTAQVSADGGTTYNSEATKSATSSGGDVTFRIKATPNTGYQFKGWSETNGSTSYKSTTAETDYTVKGHTTIGQTQSYNLYAVFNHGTYKIHFDANGGTGTMSDQNFTHGTAQKLTKNAFVNNFTVTYNTQGGNAITPETKSRFDGWTYNSVNYADETSVNLTVAHNSTLTFKAVWKSSLSFTLPTPTKKAADGTAYTFLGWYDAATGGNKVGDAGASVSISSSRTLYAHWQEYDISITANYSGSGSPTENAVFIIQRSGTPASRYRIAVAIGASTTIKNVTPGEWTVTPKAKWSWNYTASAPITKTLDAGTTSFTFTLTEKAGAKKHKEEKQTYIPTK